MSHGVRVRVLSGGCPGHPSLGTDGIRVAEGQFPLLPVFPQILVPALMVTAEKDIVLRPEMSKNMEEWVRA